MRRTTSPWSTFLRINFVLFTFILGVSAAPNPGEHPTPALLPLIRVDGEGVLLNQLVEADSVEPLPSTRLADAPAWGQSLTLSRAQIAEAMQRAGCEMAITNWAGAEKVTVTRRSRMLHELELKELLTSVLQRDHVQDKGELELRFTRPWQAIAVPDEPITLKVLELPTSGVGANFIVRFQVQTACEVIGSWQMPVQARAWREIWVARSALKRGEILGQADRVKERRDVLPIREALLGDAGDETALELAEAVPSGVPIYARAVRLRTLIRRGQVAEAFVRDGVLSLSIKVEVLEDGSFGQQVRVRNPQTKREFRGKVQDEQTILVSL
jgi:flagella basal body P-ring formation protein FlgA